MKHVRTLNNQANTAVPFLKWAGGKRWLIDRYGKHFPDSFDRYFEPFLGGAAVFFSLQPLTAYLSDANRDLIDTYRAIKQDWRSVVKHLREHSNRHSKAHYYEIRDTQPRNLSRRAARFVYLNRTCWNGLYRVNSDGHFNVPIGTKMSVTHKTDDFSAISKVLKNAHLLCADFERALADVDENDFVFIDPPYTVKHGANGFLKYNEKIFSWNDQERLRNQIEILVDRRAKVLVSQADHKSIKNLYRGIGKQFRVERHSGISGDVSGRSNVNELLIRINY